MLAKEMKKILDAFQDLSCKFLSNLIKMMRRKRLITSQEFEVLSINLSNTLKTKESQCHHTATEFS